MPGDTSPVDVTLLGIERVTGAGRLLGFAAIEIDINGIVIALSGVRIVSTGPNSLAVAAPMFRGADGASMAAVVLPPELTHVITEIVLDAFAELQQPPGARAAGRTIGGMALRVVR